MVNEYGKSEFLKSMTDKQNQRFEERELDQKWKIKNDADYTNHLEEDNKKKIEKRRSAS